MTWESRPNSQAIIFERNYRKRLTVWSIIIFPSLFLIGFPDFGKCITNNFNDLITNSMLPAQTWLSKSLWWTGVSTRASKEISPFTKGKTSIRQHTDNWWNCDNQFLWSLSRILGRLCQAGIHWLDLDPNIGSLQGREIIASRESEGPLPQLYCSCLKTHCLDLDRVMIIFNQWIRFTR
jgi:hypothetical protein